MKEYSVQNLIEGLEEKGINYEFKDIVIWAGERDENRDKVFTPTGSYQISFEIEPLIWAHYKVFPLQAENFTPDLSKEPVFFEKRYNAKIGKSISSVRMGNDILRKIIRK